MKMLPELLAPAGSWEAMIAAVAAGADAVYLGGRRYNARLLAKNFGDGELERAIAYCHARDVRVYVAVNTLLMEGELPGAIEYLVKLYEMGADGVLVQDAGLAHHARKIVPDLPLHASTQMTVHSIEGVRYLAGKGFRRVVLARELSYDEIAAMGPVARELGIGLEIFIHGALCFSYSGQCLLSTCMGGRSANRGVCAQPCRKKYTLVMGKVDEYGRLQGEPGRMCDECHLLSTRDLSTYRLLDRIVRLPVESLKIEGRMKSPAYVATVVDVYRRALDAIEAGDWKPDEEEEQRLMLAFNRRFTGGLIFGANDAEMMATDMPGDRGLRIGRVIGRGQRGMVRVRLDANVRISRGDGLVFRGEGNRECSLTLSGNTATGKDCIELPAPCDLPHRSELYLVRSTGLERWVRELIGSGTSGRPPLILEMNARWDAQNRLILEGSVQRAGGRAVSVRVASGEPAQRARVRPLTVEEIRKHLSRGIEYPFRLANLGIEYPGNLFMPLSALNRVRRELLEEATRAFVESRRPDSRSMQAVRERLERFREGRGGVPEVPAGTGNPPALGIVVDTLPCAIAALEGGADTVYFELPLGDSGRCSQAMLSQPPVLPVGVASDLREVTAVFRAHERSLFWKWPRICRLPPSVLSSDPELPLPSGFMAESTGTGEALKRIWTAKPIHGFLGLNVWNSGSIRWYSGHFEMLTLSPELPLSAISELLSRRTPDWPVIGILVEGNLEVMVSEICLPASIGLHGSEGPGAGEKMLALRDELDRIFPLRVDSAGRTRICNSVETCLIDHLPELWSIGIGVFMIDGRGRGEHYARRICEIYKSAIISMMKDIRGAKGDIKPLKDEIMDLARGGITMGPLHTGLKEGDAV